MTGLGGGLGGDENGDDVDAGQEPPDEDIDAAPEPETPDGAPAEEFDAAPDQPDAAPEIDAGPPAPATFTADIYPLLQQDGAGCANCHTAAGIAEEFPYDDGVQTVYDRVMNQPGVVNVNAPDQSLLLRRPSGEGHPVAIFTSTADSRYQLILRWIQEGAVL